MTANVSKVDKKTKTLTAAILQGNKLLQALDSLKTEGQQIPAHTAAILDIHEREHYVAMLVALLLQQANGLSDTRSRLLTILLSGLQLTDGLAALLPQAQQSDSSALRELKRLLEQRNLKHAFVVDALVLTRLDAPFDEVAIELFSELAFFLEIPQADLAVLADVASIILGIPCTRDLPPSFDLSRIAFWDAYLYRTLSAEILAAGVVTGKWQVIDELILDKPWVLEKAQLKFSEQGKISTNGAGEVRIIDSSLTDPQLYFSGEKLKVTLSGSTIRGDYPEFAKITALRFENTDLVDLVRCTITTKNARSIYSKDGRLWTRNCTFTACGNANLIGGAICQSTTDQYIEARKDNDTYKDSNGSDRMVEYLFVNGCRFDNCLARLGGGIRSRVLRNNSIRDSVFNNCQSLAYPATGDFEAYAFGGGAIFSRRMDCRKNHNVQNIKSSLFINSTVNLGSVDGVYSFDSPYAPMSECKLDNSYVRFSSRQSLNYYDDRHLLNSCTVNNKGSIPHVAKVIREYQKWWDQCD
jgi:hypothetical protein